MTVCFYKILMFYFAATTVIFIYRCYFQNALIGGMSPVEQAQFIVKSLFVSLSLLSRDLSPGLTASY